jgi:hypothetical protein
MTLDELRKRLDAVDEELAGMHRAQRQAVKELGDKCAAWRALERTLRAVRTKIVAEIKAESQRVRGVGKMR